MVDKIDALHQWVSQQWYREPVQGYLKGGNGAAFPAREWQALGGDAGFRKYFRLDCEPPLLAVYAPPDTEDSEAFVNIAQHFKASGVLSPQILAFEATQGFLLIEDLGCQLLSDELTRDSVDALYGQSLCALLKIQQSPKDGSIFPEYTSEKLFQEVNLFREWFVPKLLNYKLTPTEDNMLNEWFSLLVDSALEQPSVVVHRDYHSRNLIYRGPGEPGVIDFQDAVIGPFTYDLVSILRDCYVRWPRDRVAAWALAYLQKSKEALSLGMVSEQQFLKWFDWMGLQRHIKVLGIFARLSLRDGKHAYLSDLPLVLRYVREVAANYPEAEPFMAFFDEKLMPLITSQSWYKAVEDDEQCGVAL